MRVDLILVLAASLVTVPDRPPKTKSDPVKEDMKKLEGKWSIVSMESNGRTYPAATLQRLQYKLEITRDQFIRETRGRKHAMTFKVDLSKNPKTMDLTTNTARPRTYHAIFKLEGDTLTICQAVGRGQRPTEFASQGAQRALLMVWKRDKP